MFSSVPTISLLKNLSYKHFSYFLFKDLLHARLSFRVFESSFVTVIFVWLGGRWTELHVGYSRHKHLLGVAGATLYQGSHTGDAS